MALAEVAELKTPAKSWVPAKKQLFINGKWLDAKSGKTFDVENPATGDVIAKAAEGDKADIDAAVKAARKAFESGPWKDMSTSERGKIIWKIGDLILANADELAELESVDNGKPLAVARAADVPLSADLFHYMAGWATKITGDTFQISTDHFYTPGQKYFTYTLKEPVGVVGQIIPWNFPLLMAAWKLGPVLATGNTVVLKPAEQTPLSALRLAEIIQEAGVPDGVLNVVTGFGEAGAALAAHDDVDKVAFTGSTEVGKMIVQAAAGNLKKVTLELGGKSPNVVFKDVANLDATVQGAASAIFFNHGQCCCAGSRLYIEKPIFNDVVAGVSEVAKKMKIGPGLESPDMGPLVSKVQFETVTGYIKSGQDEGAKCAVGGGTIGDKGYFVEPTVLTNTNDKMKVIKEEIFGPVVTAEPFEDHNEIIARSNNSTYGLAAAVWTSDLQKALKTAEAFRAGTVWVNTFNIFDAALPFGGYKQSGWGREMGREILDAYTETKSVIMAK